MTWAIIWSMSAVTAAGEVPDEPHNRTLLLSAVGGRGYYQEWGKEPVELNPGDVVYVASETKHWHGAAPDSDFAHIAIMNVVDGTSNEWLEPVEAEYDALRCIDEAAKSM